MSFSRLQTNEKTKLIRQSVLFLAGGCLIIVIFLFGLLPFYTRLLMRNSQQTKLPTATPAVNIPSPSLLQPFTSTNSAQVVIKGTAPTNMKVLLGVNGSVDQSTTSKEDGSFAFDTVTLLPGDNMLQAYAEDSSGNRSDGSKPITITFSTDAPKLEVTAPSDNALITQRKQSVIAVSGTTDAGNKVYLNDQFLFVTDTGSFSGSFQLQEGDNTLHIRAVNAAGNETSKDVHVKYIP